jgi:hypothetical protein
VWSISAKQVPELVSTIMEQEPVTSVSLTEAPNGIHLFACGLETGAISIWSCNVSCDLKQWKLEFTIPRL